MMIGGYDHLHPAIRALADLDATTRISSLKNKPWIDYPAAASVLAAFQRVISQPTSERMENILVLGESGMGKTRLLRKFEQANASAFDGVSGIQRRPIVVVPMVDKVDEDDFFACLLETLKAPISDILSISTKRKRKIALTMLKELETKVLGIDEINSLLVGSARQQRLFLQLLRYLSNTLGIALICTGIPEARHALMADPQLRSRFYERELPLWQPNDALQVFINRAVAGMPLRRPSPIDSEKVRQLLVERSGGLTIFIHKALSRSAEVAIQLGREMIDYEILIKQEVWEDIRAKDKTASLI